MEYIKEIKNELYTELLTQTEEYLSQLEGDETAPANISFFLEEAQNYLSGKCMNNKKKIAMTGIYFPEVIIHALHARPVWVLGGSRVSGETVDDYLPRDVDPIVRSSIGYINMEKLSNFNDCSLYIVPMVSDSIKKSLPLFPGKMKIHPFDVCSLLFENKTAQWVSELRKTIVKLEEVTGVKLTEENLRTSMIMVNRSGKLLEQLKDLYEMGYMSNGIYFFLRQSYYVTQDASRWIREMEHVVDFYSNRNAPNGKSKYISLIGSPIFPPNDKIPRLLDDLGLIVKYMDVGLPSPCSYSGFETLSSVEELLESVESQHYGRTFGAYHVSPFDPVLPSSGRKNGIVFHLLKGQVNYVFMCEKYDKFASENDMSMITIETDYGNADLEQIKIRLEAFSEMLKQEEIKEVQNAGRL